MTKPIPGLTISPVAFRRCRDADTVELSIPGSAFVFAVRLIDVWAPELRGGDTKLAHEGTQWLTNYLAAADPADLLVHIPQPKGSQPLQWLTFDRVPGYIWRGDTNVNELIVSQGYASSVKGGRCA